MAEAKKPKGTTLRAIRIDKPMWDALEAGAKAEGTDRTKFLLTAAREKLAALGIEIPDDITPPPPQPETQADTDPAASEPTPPAAT